VIRSAIVTGMHHTKMAAQLRGCRFEFIAQASMPSIQTDSDVCLRHCTEQPEHIGRVPKEQMRQFVLQGADQSDSPAMTRNLGQRTRAIFQPPQAIGSRWMLGVLWPGMN